MLLFNKHDIDFLTFGRTELTMLSFILLEQIACLWSCIISIFERPLLDP